MQVRDFRSNDLKSVARCLQRDRLNRKSKFQAETRASWLNEALENRNLVIKIAAEGKRLVGFAEYLPLRVAPTPITGHNLYYINCLQVDSQNSGKVEVGRTLLNELELDVRRQAAGVATIAYDYDLEFASVDFYRKAGYREVSRGGTSVVLVKKFRDVASPRFMRSQYQYRPVPSKVVVDAFWSGACQRAIADIYNVRRACQRFEDRVVLNEYNAASRQDRDFVGGVIRALSINGRWLPVSTLPEIQEERVVEALEKAFANVGSSAPRQ